MEAELKIKFPSAHNLSLFHVMVSRNISVIVYPCTKFVEIAFTGFNDWVKRLVHAVSIKKREFSLKFDIKLANIAQLIFEEFKQIGLK